MNAYLVGGPFDGKLAHMPSPGCKDMIVYPKGSLGKGPEGWYYSGKSMDIPIFFYERNFSNPNHAAMVEEIRRAEKELHIPALHYRLKTWDQTDYGIVADMLEEHGLNRAAGWFRIVVENFEDLAKEILIPKIREKQCGQ